MHEFKITEKLLETALAQSQLQPGEQIQRLYIQLDPESGYTSDAIHFYFDQLASDTPAAHAELVFEQQSTPHHIRLLSVDIDETPMASPIASSPRHLVTLSPSHPVTPHSVPSTRWRIDITGVVQGVGFRPFVHHLALDLGLSGWVRNTSTGVTLEIQGTHEQLEHFYHHLRHDPPPLAHILDLQVKPIPLVSDERARGLQILPSHVQEGRTLVSPDVATCPACLHEHFDPSDRRYHYPFINCTHCGPRFTIINELPYDRPLTTMAAFPLCDECEAEYRDADDRRFHAQPVACPVCGPQVWYVERKNGRLGDWEIGDKQTPHPVTPSPLHPFTPSPCHPVILSSQLLLSGGILALKGLGGFHLACCADDAVAIQRLRAAKYRPSKPLALMVRDLAAAEALCHINPSERSLLLSPEAPIVLLRKRADCPLPGEIAPDNGSIGVMLPYTPLHHLLLQAVGVPLVMTSGNPVGEPLILDNDDALAQLPFADGYLLHNRPIARRCDDSVLFVADLSGRTTTQLVRRSRGLAPLPLLLPESLTLESPLVAMGADIKNVSAVAVDRLVFLTPHIGDLSSPTVRSYQTDTLADFERLFHIQPTTLVCDLHPDYASSRAGRERAKREHVRLLEVQHHHAHIAGCLAENQHTDVAIGLAFDGSGYGSDGTIWGGEALLCDLANIYGRVHLQALPLPGGDAATKRPIRIAYAYLRTLLPEVDPTDWLPDLGTDERNVIQSMLDQQINTPLTSSMGRLFDAVAALLGLCVDSSHEAQAAIALENAALASDYAGPGYDFYLCDDTLQLAPIFAGILFDHKSGKPVSEIARRFHITVAEMAVKMAEGMNERGTADDTDKADEIRINLLNPRHPWFHPPRRLPVALSGGVWQNRLLLELSVPKLEEAGFTVLLHKAVPANDGGIAYGQTVVAAAVLGKELTMDDGR